MTPTLLYDGRCNLCSSTVRLLLRLDRDRVFRFAPLQSEDAERILAPHDLDPAHTCSVVLVAAGRVHTRSEALVHAAAFLPDPWRRLKHLRHVPRGLRDRLYDLVARLRYRIFGRREECFLPPPDRRP